MQLFIVSHSAIENAHTIIYRVVLLKIFKCDNTLRASGICDYLNKKSHSAAPGDDYKDNTTRLRLVSLSNNLPSASPRAIISVVALYRMLLAYIIAFLALFWGANYFSSRTPKLWRTPRSKNILCFKNQNLVIKCGIICRVAFCNRKCLYNYL